MKTPFNKLYQQFLVKAIVAITGLLVVVPQVSYKFYLCANAPALFSKTHLRTDKPVSPANLRNISFAHDKHHHFSIDKRYTVKHLFALPSAPLAMGDQLIYPLDVFASGPMGTVGAVLSSHRLRGPPASSSFV